MFPFSVAPAPSAVPPKKAEADDLFARAPLLRDGCDRVTAALVKSLQTMAGPSIVIDGSVAAQMVSSPREAIAFYRPDSAIASIVVKDLPCLMLVSLDATLVHAFIELLCGGNGIEPRASEPRAITPIDQQFAQTFFALTASAMQTEWADIGFSSARAAVIEGLLTADVFGPYAEDVGIVDITIGLFGMHGTFRLVLPPEALDAFGGTAATSIAADETDPLWSLQLQKELGRTSVSLAAYLDAKDLPLGSLAKLQVGQILSLPADARSRATLVSDGSILYRGEIGREDDRYSLRINELVTESAGIAQMAARHASYFEVSKG